jgi:DNA-binding CsgD family transcriptional regulator
MTLDTTPQRNIVWLAENIKSSGTKTDFFRCLQDICRTIGGKHSSFIMRHVPGVVGDDPFTVDTFGEAWHRHALELRYEAVDPILSFNDCSGQPMDWLDIPKSKIRTKRYFKDFMEFQLGRQAITATFRGSQGDRSLLTLTADCSEKRWASMRQEFGAAIAVLHPTLHRAVLKVRFQIEEITLVRLTRREKECLAWAAHGNTSREISESLGLTPATVNFFIDAAVNKLSAANRAHAAAKAVALGLIAPPR